jgi:hypothetical protein
VWSWRIRNVLTHRLPSWCANTASECLRTRRLYRRCRTPDSCTLLRSTRRACDRAMPARAIYTGRRPRNLWTSGPTRGPRVSAGVPHRTHGPGTDVFHDHRARAFPRAMAERSRPAGPPQRLGQDRHWLHRRKLGGNRALPSAADHARLPAIGQEFSASSANRRPAVAAPDVSEAQVGHGVLRLPVGKSSAQR